MEDKFCVIFKGDLIEGHTRKDVQNSLAKLFSLPAEQIRPFFERKSIFFRSNIERFTAEKYYREFREIGARAFIGHNKDIPENQESGKNLAEMELATCPFCNEDQINRRHCLFCYGHPLEKIQSGKHSAPVTAALTAREDPPKAMVEPDLPDADIQGHKLKAVKAFRIAGILMIALFLAEEFLFDKLKLMALQNWQTDYPEMGILPLIIATLIMAKGAWHYVQTKGYHPIFSILGLGNIVGLGFLILLPNKFQRPEEKGFNLVHLSALAMIGCGLFWAQDALSQHLKIKHFLDQPVPFADLLIADGFVPEGTDPESDIERHESYLIDYLDTGFRLIEKYELDPVKTEALADRVHQAVSGLNLWLNYQAFLAWQNDMRIPDEYTKKSIRQILQPHVNALIQACEELENPIVNRIHTDWKGYYSREDDPTLKKFINSMQQRLYMDILYRIDSTGHRVDISTGFKEISESHNPVTDPFIEILEADGNQLFIQLKTKLPDSIAGKTILFGTWMEEGPVKWSHKLKKAVSTYPTLKRIGGNISDKYMPHNNDLFASLLLDSEEIN